MASLVQHATPGKYFLSVVFLSLVEFTRDSIVGSTQRRSGRTQVCAAPSLSPRSVADFQSKIEDAEELVEDDAELEPRSPLPLRAKGVIGVRVKNGGADGSLVPEMPHYPDASESFERGRHSEQRAHCEDGQHDQVYRPTTRQSSTHPGEGPVVLPQGLGS